MTMNIRVIFFAIPAILAFMLSFSSSVAAQDRYGKPEDTAQQYFANVGKMADYQMPPTVVLHGQRFAWVRADGMTSEIVFGKDGRASSYSVGEATHAIAAEVFEFAEDLYFMAFTIDGDARGITMVVDRRTGRLIEIIGRRPVPEENTHRIQFEVFQAVLKEKAEMGVLPLETSGAMTGARFIEQCADDIVYEHVYLNPHRVTWHAIVSPEAGQADTESYDAYTLRPQVHLVAWSEKVMAIHATFLFNFETNQNIGFIFGHDLDNDKVIAETFGCKLTVLQPPGGKVEERP